MIDLFFCSLSSGSSGNCYYLGSKTSGILIDAGISARSIRNFLKDIDVSIESVMGIIISHNHSDHIKGLQTLAGRFHIPIFTSKTVWNHILQNPSQKKITGDCIRTIEIHKPFQIAGFTILGFPVSHDTPETLGFHIHTGMRNITIVTDLGYICENAAKYISQANFLVIESNYDRTMLQEGGYPWFLKQRISSNTGHLENTHTSQFLAENINEDLTHICLAHLSKENNSPEIAIQTLQRIFLEKGVALPDVRVLRRNVPSDLILL